MALTQSICCHKQCRQWCQPADWTLKGNELNSLLQSSEKLSSFGQNPLNAPPTWLLDGNSTEKKVTRQGGSNVLCYVKIHPNWQYRGHSCEGRGKGLKLKFSWRPAEITQKSFRSVVVIEVETRRDKLGDPRLVPCMSSLEKRLNQMHSSCM